MFRTYHLAILFTLIGTAVFATDRSSQVDNQIAPTSSGGGSQLVTDQMRSIVGKLAGCTGTVVSPPGVKPVMVLTASHCRQGRQSFQLPDGQRLPVTCVGNKDWKSSTGEDVALCSGTMAAGLETSSGGCLDTTAEPKPGTRLLSVGYGNPRWNHPMLDKPAGLGSIVDKIIQRNRVILARTPGGYVTPGDSGGPAFEDNSNQSGFLTIAGVNSKHINGTHVSYSPLATPENVDFFRRAIAYFAETVGRTPTVCGVNYQPHSPNPAGQFDRALASNGIPHAQLESLDGHRAQTH